MTNPVPTVRVMRASVIAREEVLPRSTLFIRSPPPFSNRLGTSPFAFAPHSTALFWGSRSAESGVPERPFRTSKHRWTTDGAQLVRVYADSTKFHRSGQGRRAPRRRPGGAFRGRLGSSAPSARLKARCFSALGL